MKALSNEFMQHIAEDEAWKDLSRELHWTESMLEKYANKLDWKEISESSNIFWTIPMIQKFKNRINWDSLSENICEESLTEELVDTFVDKWNWTELSRNSSLELTDELLAKYADRWDWEEIIDRYRDSVFEKKGIDFYEKFKDYIPASKVQGSRLWSEIVSQRKSQLLNEIIA